MWRSHKATSLLAISHKTGIKNCHQVIGRDLQNENWPNADAKTTFITPVNLALTLKPHSFISVLICSRPHDHNPSSSKRVRREKMMKKKDWQPAGQDASGINLKRSHPMKEGHTFFFYHWRQTDTVRVDFCRLFTTWPGNCPVEWWPSVSCCLCWRPRPCHLPAPRIQSWPRPHGARRSCGRRRGVGWRNPPTGTPGMSGRQAHRPDHWNPGHIWWTGCNGKKRSADLWFVQVKEYIHPYLQPVREQCPLPEQKRRQAGPM